jgi:ATP-dependent DNA helicase DinG
MSLSARVARAFATDGVLAAMRPRLVPRDGQMRMAQEVAQTIEDGGILVAEAGTGIGKTYAYLVPVLLSGSRAMVSTATKALQDQLFKRDIPGLLAAMVIPARVAMLKGRASYLCQNRLADARQRVPEIDTVRLSELAQVERWATCTTTGDLAEVGVLEDDSPLVPLVTSTSENCLGTGCPHAAACHVNQARNAAMAADIVVINHHLFFADMNVRAAGGAGLLPTVTTMVFDEAHHLNDVGLQFLACQWSTSQLELFSRDLEKAGSQRILGTSDWRATVGCIDECIETLRAMCSGLGIDRLAWRGNAPAGIDAGIWTRLVNRLVAALKSAQTSLTQVQDQSAALRQLWECATSLVERTNLFSEATPPGLVRWLEPGSNVRFSQSPLSIAKAIQVHLPTSHGSTAVRRRSWVFTSATLGHDAALSWFVDSCGLQEARLLRVDSPFDYAMQAALYVPRHLPKPNHPMHSDCVALLTAQCAEILGGRTLVLTTTLRALRSIGAMLHQYHSGPSCIEVLVQGEHSKRELIARFCRAPEPGRRGGILVASASFWEGLDVSGDALQLVIIDKLPFAPPDDPLVAARSRELESEGKKPFLNLHLPLAAVALKQGAGRLIRSEADRGILVICDARLVQTGYGKKILKALPPMTELSTHEQFLKAIAALTTTSTKVG